MKYETTTKRRQKTFVSLASQTLSLSLKKCGIMKSMESVVDAVMVIEERVETDAAMSRTRITPIRTFESPAVFNIFGIR